MCISLYQHQWAQWVLVCISMYCIRVIGIIIFSGIDVDNRWSRYFYYYQKFFVIVCLLPNILSWLYLLIVFRKFWNWGSLCSYGNHGTDRGGVLKWKWEDGWEVHELCREREQGTHFSCGIFHDIFKLIAESLWKSLSWMRIIISYMKECWKTSTLAFWK